MAAHVHKIYEYDKPVFVRGAARADGTYVQGQTIGQLAKNLYDNPSGGYLFTMCLLNFLHDLKFAPADTNICNLTHAGSSGTIYLVLSSEYFLVSATNRHLTKKLYSKLSAKYEIKRLNTPQR